MNCEVAYEDLVAEDLSHLIDLELFMVLSCLSSLHVHDVDAGVVTRVNQLDLDDVQQLSHIITER